MCISVSKIVSYYFMPMSKPALEPRCLRLKRLPGLEHAPPVIRRKYRGRWFSASRYAPYVCMMYSRLPVYCGLLSTEKAKNRLLDDNSSACLAGLFCDLPLSGTQIRKTNTKTSRINSKVEHSNRKSQKSSQIQNCLRIPNALVIEIGSVVTV